MSCVHYKFASRLRYDRVIFQGREISLSDLKHQIMGREKLKASNCDLRISNAQTDEEYTDDNALIPKNSSVTVRRIPAGRVKATSKTSVLSRTEPGSGTSKALDDSSAPVSLAQLIKTDDLAEANASAQDTIKAMMTQSCREYDPMNYGKKPLAPPPPSYICFRCGKPGHYIKHCPTNGDKNFKPVPRIKKSTGIPRSFMMEVKDPNTKGAMLTNTGQYAIPIINAEAYARGKKEKPPFSPEEPPSSSSCTEDPIPDELLCLICKEIMTDAAVIPCCGNSYCDECIRTALLDSEEHKCPTCHQTDVSPDALIANQFLRKAVNNFSNGSGYTKRLPEQIQQQQQPPPLMTVTPPGPFRGADSVTPPAALVTAHLVSGSQRCPQGQTKPTTGHPVRASTPRSAGGRPGCELSKSPHSASSYSTSYTYSMSRPGSSHSRSFSRSFSHSRSRSCSRSPPSPRRGKGKRQREVPAYERKAYYGRSLAFRDPFERERHRERERNYRGRYENFYKGYAAAAQPRPPVNREDFSADRFGPPGTGREDSPYARGRREGYPGGQSHQNHNRARNGTEKRSGRDSHGIKVATKSKEKEVENPLGGDEGNKQKKQQKRRRGDENEGFPNAELLEGARKPREPVTAEDVRTDSLFKKQRRST